MTRTRKYYSSPYSVRPTPELTRMLDAIDKWLHSEEDDDFQPPRMATLEAVIRGMPYADASCDGGCPDLNFPHRLRRDSRGGWIADYLCRGCGKPYRASWADYWFLHALGF